MFDQCHNLMRKAGKIMHGLLYASLFPLSYVFMDAPDEIHQEASWGYLLLLLVGLLATVALVLHFAGVA